MDNADLFRRLYDGEPEGYIGLFFLNRRKGLRHPQQLPVNEWEHALEIAADMSGKEYDAYFSPALLKDKLPQGQRGTKEHYIGAKALWVDIDPDEKRTQQDIRIQLLEYEPRPSIIVSSGNGMHAYWLLDQLAVQTEIESRNYALQTALGGDACHSIDHLFRIPGTMNWK